MLSEEQQRACRQALLHRAATGRPFSVLKYAMTADGKIATCAGHAAWVSSPASRQLVFEARMRSDAIVVGGNTVRAPRSPGHGSRVKGAHAQQEPKGCQRLRCTRSPDAST